VAEGLDVKTIASGERHTGGRNGRSRESREANMLKPLLSAVVNDQSSSLCFFPAFGFCRRTDQRIQTLYPANNAHDLLFHSRSIHEPQSFARSDHLPTPTIDCSPRMR
jgi:hypothetical protein